MSPLKQFDKTTIDRKTSLEPVKEEEEQLNNKENKSKQGLDEGTRRGKKGRKKYKGRSPSKKLQTFRKQGGGE